MHDLIRVFWHGHDGSVFTLLGDREKQGVTLQSPGNLVSAVSRSLVGRANAIGADVLSHVIDSMADSLTVVVTADSTSGRSLPEVWRQWRNSWSTKKPGRLVVNVLGESWGIDLIADKNIPVPERSPYSPNTQHVVSSVSVLGLDGIWSGEAHTYSGSATVSNPGTVDLHPVVTWSGSGKTVTLPGGRVVALPTVTNEYRVNLDPGSGFKVTGELGAAVWAAFRGRDLRAPIPPGESRTFQLSSGVRLEATPLHENPWG